MEKDSFDEGGYKFHCCLDASRAEFVVEGMLEEVVPEEGLYLHVDLEIPGPDEKNDLRVNVTTLRSGREVNARFNEKDIALFRDGNRLHVSPVLLTELLGAGYELGADDTDLLQLLLYVNEDIVLEERIPVAGPWPRKESAFITSAKDLPAVAGIEEQMAAIQNLPGWQNFKTRIEEVVARSRVSALRKDAGLAENAPRLHAVVIGNPGTGKSSCVAFMARLYKTLGLLNTDAIETTRVSMLASSNVNGEYENTKSAIDKAAGGTLLFENAHELWHVDKGGHYDTEQRIIRALVEALGEKSRRWMLVLSGEPEGLESLLAANPDLKKYLGAPVYMEDFKPEELFWMVDAGCESRGLKLSPEARAKLEMYILHQYNHRGPGFQNAWLVQELLDTSIIPAMYRRLESLETPTPQQLETVEATDIPSVSGGSDAAMAELDAMVGLGSLKAKVKDYLSAVKLAALRMEQGLPTSMPRLHMAFLGNPGTGKTTVAEIIGRIFASWGILSGGRVIKAERNTMVGQWIGETESKMRNLLDRARGNILFIDEAYQLVEDTTDRRDFGRIVMDSLLTELGKDHQDMVVIIAGYTAPMKRLMESNEGIESRFPNVFNFEDYTTDELVEIGKIMIRKQGFTLTEGAERNMRSIIEEEAEKPSPRFGNGRFVSNLLQNEILATLGARTAQLPHPTREELCTILPEDVIVGKARKEVVFDDVAIDAALARLDALAGLAGVKKAIHNFVTVARYLHAIGEPYVGKGLLSWRFIGRSGTGKSTVAGIMAQILKGMHLIANSHITEVKGERLFGTYNESQVVLQDAVKRSCNGLIFVDVDSARFSSDRDHFSRTIEQALLKLKELTVEAGGECALIVADLDAPHGDVAEELSRVGIYEFDHTLIFNDFTPDELFEILVCCLAKLNVGFTPKAEEHMRAYLRTLPASVSVNARTMKLMARTIHQQVILREAALPERPAAHRVELADVETFKWNGKRGRIGF